MESDVKRKAPKLSLSAGGVLLFVAFCALADPPQVPDDTVPQVTVHAQREAIEPRVKRFVDEYFYLENDEGPARWISQVCPSVVGMTRGEGEFILLRLSRIAREVGVPLAGEQCKPANLYVIATARPTEVLHAWDKKTHGEIFGDSAIAVVDEFLDTPRPVRAWYNSTQVGAQSGAEGAAVLPSGVSMGSPGDLPVPSFARRDSGSRITRQATWSLKSVVVVVDKTKLSGVTWQQLADYVGMSAYSRFKPGTHHANAPTILDLFDDLSGQPPPGLSAWDEAFLEALYHSDPALVQQTQTMVTRMVRHIVPEDAPEPPSLQ
jgi:hypothetical protein